MVGFLEKQIQLCEDLGGMGKERWAFQQCLKEANKLSPTDPEPFTQKQKEKIEELLACQKKYCLHAFEACDEPQAISSAIINALELGVA